ncbi:Similar to nudt19: Nucleoside diphosphate-linked moiety X motif 19 (Xenopus laevis) [Cotesia congregata]|uniref:Similar to nudt19: Nucleoside diphosphate-linked moiety X motif 19 (Xenopus laevis) n=1 Tax=Cotesia congregata TaxID=51543 RepID=A0A8J2MQM1_COTCN|nr:Similar to nudt19: Nucleoside diphosphate-linked moiety X motif 19 (Xenopus laevis) [Cotesia congregata]
MKNWRDAASIILAAHYKNNLSQQLKTNPADADFKWKSLYKKFGFNDNHFLSLLPNNNNNNSTSSSSKLKPIIFEAQSSNELPREVSLRITAIRETFEECGILIAASNGKNSAHAQHYTITGKKLVDWQKKVHANAAEFYEMCESLQCYPDLWSLHAWSNWLTPVFLGGKRFNSIFFIACLQSIPDAQFDPKEMEALIWKTPKELVDKSEEFKLAPPQQYQINEISKIHQLNDLLDEAIERNEKDMLLYYPIRIILSDGIIYLFPGDAMYPKEVHLSEVNDIVKNNLTIQEFHDQSVGPKNRMFRKGKNAVIKVLE